MAATASDARIRTEVLDALRYDVRIDETNLTVGVAQGVVHLAGTVPTDFEKNEARHDVWLVAGVRDVVDELSIAA